MTAVPYDLGGGGVYSVATFGWDGSGPILYTGAYSTEVTMPCR